MSMQADSVLAPDTRVYRERYERKRIRMNSEGFFAHSYDEFEKLFSDHSLSLKQIARQLYGETYEEHAIVLIADRLGRFRRQFFPVHVRNPGRATAENRALFLQSEKNVRASPLFERLQEMTWGLDLSVSLVRLAYGYSGSLFDIDGVRCIVQFKSTYSVQPSTKTPYLEFRRQCDIGLPWRFAILFSDVKGPDVRHRDVFVIPNNEYPSQMVVNLSPKRLSGTNIAHWAQYLGGNGTARLVAAVEKAHSTGA